MVCALPGKVNVTPSDLCKNKLCCTRTGWKVHSLTKGVVPQQWNLPYIKCNLSGYYLHCFLPDIHTLDRSLMTLKSITRDISKRPRKLTRESCCTWTMLPDTTSQVCGSNGCCARLWLWTGWSPSIFSWFGTIWLFFVPHMKKNTHTWLGSSIRPMMRSYMYLQLRTFSQDQDESFYTTGIQVLQHRWKKCVDRRGDYVEKINLIWSNSTFTS